ncbi:MAG: hypothetical protein PHX72_02780 [Candidatus Shapirobacteria bacterium]|nr:hypothetical protein [Candidatus Shapirobacteria bacterium]
MNFFGRKSLSLTEAILAALAYSDLFSYPLTSEEVWFWLPKKATQKTVVDQLRLLVDQGRISYQAPFYFLNQAEIITSRRKKEVVSKQKMLQAKKISRQLARFSWVGLVAISGNLAMRAAESDDDIDFLIIAPIGHLYRARLISVLVTEAWGLRRRPNQQLAPDKVCLNLFLEADNLLLPPFRRDFYTAHEALQLLPISGNNDFYQKFLFDNGWLADYLPQAYQGRFTGFEKTDLLTKNSLDKNAFEEISRFGQLVYRKLRCRCQNNLDRQLFFHPQDQRKIILERFEKNWQKLTS